MIEPTDTAHVRSGTADLATAVDLACRVWTRARATGDPLPLDGRDVTARRAAAPALSDRPWAHLARRV